MLKLQKGWEEAREHAQKVGSAHEPAPGWLSGAGLAAIEPATMLPVGFPPWVGRPPTSCAQRQRLRRALTTATGPHGCFSWQAVGDDSRLRAFFVDDTRGAGLLFGCQGATPLLEEPLGRLPLCLAETHGLRAAAPSGWLVPGSAKGTGLLPLRATQDLVLIHISIIRALSINLQPCWRPREIPRASPR